MAGTTLDHELTAARAGHGPFASATQNDDAGIRRLLRENPMPGRISLTLECEPDYFADSHLPGIEKQTIVASKGGSLVCVGSCALRTRFVNGQPCRVGYLGGLRLDARAAGRFDILRRGYGFFRELQSNKPADFYFTSIAADNVPAQRFLERGLPGMPAYEFVGDFVAVLLPADRRRIHAAPTADMPCLGELLDFLERHSRNYQFAPRWSTQEWSALPTLGLKAEDLHCVRDGGRIVAAAALWDQRAYKQTVVRRYAPSLAAARPLLNLAAGVIGTPRLPAVGSVLAHAYLSHLAVAPDKPEALISLIAGLRIIAEAKGIQFLTLGFAASDPRLALLRTRFRSREYRSRIYVVSWPGLGGLARDLDGRCLGPEVALL
jgi:hypothetical protein